MSPQRPPQNPPQSEMPIRQTPWLRVTRERLAELWAANTGHLPGVRRQDWASELMNACAETKGHLSVPCSLREQANYIGVFLMSPSFDNAPVLFLKLYTILLSEFNGQLKDVAGLLKLDCDKPPRKTSVWANCLAKHALSILVQHHPRYAFADDLGTDWAIYQTNPHSLFVRSQRGVENKPTIIDTDWLCNSSSCKDPSQVVFVEPPVIVVPPLADYLQETMQYFRQFVNLVLTNPCIIQKFEGEFHDGFVEIKGGSQSRKWLPVSSR